MNDALLQKLDGIQSGIVARNSRFQVALDTLEESDPIARLVALNVAFKSALEEHGTLAMAARDPAVRLIAFEHCKATGVFDAKHESYLSLLSRCEKEIGLIEVGANAPAVRFSRALYPFGGERGGQTEDLLAIASEALHMGSSLTEDPAVIVSAIDLNKATAAGELADDEVFWNQVAKCERRGAVMPQMKQAAADAER